MKLSKSNPRIPLLKAEHAAPFIAFTAAQGATVTPLLERAKLPGQLTETIDGFVPEHRVWLFADVAAKKLGMDDFGLQVGKKIGICDFGILANSLSACPTLFTCIEAFCELARQESSEAHFWLQSDSQQLWFSRAGIPNIVFGERHIEHYTLLMMLEVIRLKLGPNWSPSVIHIQSDPCPNVLATPPFANTQVKFRQAFTSIAIGHTEMAIPPSSSTNILLNAQQQEHDFIRNLTEALYLYNRRQFVTMEEASGIIGISPRTLQRRLKDNGINFKNLTDRLKLQASLNLMKDQSIKLTDIAHELGYSDSAHFSRAFQRWTGLAPSKYRSTQIFETGAT